jgi:hypothetical protein
VNFEFTHVSDMVRAAGSSWIPVKWHSASMHMAFKMILTVVGTAIVAIPDDERRGPDRETGLRIVPVRHTEAPA